MFKEPEQSRTTRAPHRADGRRSGEAAERSQLVCRGFFPLSDPTLRRSADQTLRRRDLTCSLDISMHLPDGETRTALCSVHTRRTTCFTLTLFFSRNGFLVLETLRAPNCCCTEGTQAFYECGASTSAGGLWGGGGCFLARQTRTSEV